MFDGWNDNLANVSKNHKHMQHPIFEDNDFITALTVGCQLLQCVCVCVYRGINSTTQIQGGDENGWKVCQLSYANISHLHGTFDAAAFVVFFSFVLILFYFRLHLAGPNSQIMYKNSVLESETKERIGVLVGWLGLACVLNVGQIAAAQLGWCSVSAQWKTELI